MLKRERQKYIFVSESKSWKIYVCNEFRENDRVLIMNKLSKSSDYLTNDSADKFEEAYLESISKIEGDRDELYPANPIQGENEERANSTMHLPNNIPSQHTHSRLRKIQVPVFEGKFSEWPHYRDMYYSLVHTDKQLSKVEKFWYLKDSLRGEPYDMVKHMVTTEENYTAAWKLLTDNYENSRELFKSQMHLFSSQPKINDENASSICSLLNVSRECRQ